MKYLTIPTQLGLVLIMLLLSVSRSDGAFKVYGMEEVCAGQSPAPVYWYDPPNDPQDMYIFLSQAHTWSVSGGTIVSGGGISDPTATVNWASCGNGVVTLELTVYYLDRYFNPQQANFMTSLNVKVLYNLPSTVTISGPPTIPCNVTEPVVYTVDIPQCPGQEYAWKVDPPTWIVQSGHGTPSITVIPDPFNPGTLAVAVVSIQGCGSGPSLGTRLIPRDCPTDILYNTSTTSLPINSVADTSVVADVGAGGVIAVLPFQAVLFKAGKVIRIKRNFIVGPQAVFTARIGLCDNCFALKKKPDPKIEDDDEKGGINDLEASDPFSIKVCPNPSDGIYKITFEGDWQHLKGANQLRIYSMGGVLIKDISFYANETPFQIDLTDQPPGVYIFNLKTEVGDFMEKMIKQ